MPAAQRQPAPRRAPGALRRLLGTALLAAALALLLLVAGAVARPHG
jgi:hypothetical protein